MEREALWVPGRKWLRAKQLESGVCMGFGRAGGSSWDKHGTAPEGMNSVLEIHRPPRGKPSPFILTTHTPTAAFSLSFQGISFS